MWFLNDLERCHQEREAIEALATDVDWLSMADWKFSEGKIMPRRGH